MLTSNDSTWTLILALAVLIVLALLLAWSLRHSMMRGRGSASPYTRSDHGIRFWTVAIIDAGLLLSALLLCVVLITRAERRSDPMEKHSRL
jgi:quinol-cytochrome oxidoreductase complex cytochrome b subunit